MAAGMGSRFGSLKQVEPVGPSGQIILDYSIHDAVKAGFDTAVIVIRKDTETEFRNVAGKRIEKMMDVKYVFQELDNIPDGFVVPDGRTKPWGTGHAVLCAKDVMDCPFIIINADDYYGQSVYATMHDFLVNNDEMCMAGYALGNTLSENGTVSRGVCSIKDGYLCDVVEHTDIGKDTKIPLDTVVSMNMWGLRPRIFDMLEKDFVDFMKIEENPLKKEFYIPSVIDKMIKTTDDKVKVLNTDEKWYGMTYREDMPIVKSAIKNLTDMGLYKENF